MGVRRIEQELRPFEPVLLLYARGDDIRNSARQSYQIGSHNHHPSTLAIV